MFEKKQIIYSETQGVCQVENIVSLSASRRERKIPYYVLRPVFDKSRVSYIPVENHQVKLRELFTREEAEALQGTEEMKKDEKLRQAVEYVLGKKGGIGWHSSSHSRQYINLYLEIKNLKERQRNSSMTKAGTVLRIL